MPALRDAIARRCGVPPEFVLTTQGAAHGLFLPAFELCRPGDKVVLATPCFSPARDTLVSRGASLRLSASISGRATASTSTVSPGR